MAHRRSLTPPRNKGSSYSKYNKNYPRNKNYPSNNDYRLLQIIFYATVIFILYNILFQNNTDSVN